ncbi:MAG: thiamine pyrophosphate-binding protein, partial [Bauldia sp.]|nr:thiamine pyrophosphate-binding protein [Bauldia sp.]
PITNPGPVQLSQIVAWLRERLPDDATITNGAGNYSNWIHRFFHYRRFGTQLGPTSGSMGYGMPAAIAAKLANPDRIVVAFAGDGCFQMTSQEFATAVQEKAAIVVIVVNNGIHGTIRMHQERDYPDRHIATDLVDPDFAALARAHGGHGETVTRTEDFAEAFNNALHSGKPAIIDLKFDPEAITPTRTMSEIRGSGRR